VTFGGSPEISDNMPRIIRNALYQKLLESPDLVQFRTDFELATGLHLRFVNELGLGEGFGNPRSVLCQEMQKTVAGERFCGRSRHALLERAIETPCAAVCDAGLSEAAVPIRVGGITAGYFVFGGTTLREPSERGLHRVDHLLRKAGVPVAKEKLEKLLIESRFLPEELLGAYLRIISLAAQHIALSITARTAESTEEMPRAVAKACQLIQQRATREDLNLSDVSRQCGTSTGHLSRLFHQTTGLTFREYLGRVRADRARELLCASTKSITEVAYDAGFQSLSQFHRVFRKVHGCAPREIRKSKAPGPGAISIAPNLGELVAA